VPEGSVAIYTKPFGKPQAGNGALREKGDGRAGPRGGADALTLMDAVIHAIPIVMSFVLFAGLMYLFIRRNREGGTILRLRDEMQGPVCLSTRLDHASKLGEGGFNGTRGMWISFRGPKRLVVGTDAFMISMPQALREFVFIGRESSIAMSRSPSRLVQRDWIIITGQFRGRQIHIAITKKEGIQEIWQALAGAGARQVTG
jgi:hypothetical protein